MDYSHGVRSGIAQEKQQFHKNHFKAGYRYLSSQFNVVRPEFNSIDRPVRSLQIYILLVKFKNKPSDINKPYLQLRFAIELSFSTSNVSHGQIYGSPDGLDDSRRPAQEV